MDKTENDFEDRAMPEAKEKKPTDSSTANAGDKTPAKKPEPEKVVKAVPAANNSSSGPAAPAKSGSSASILAIIALLAGGGALIGGYSSLQSINASISDLSQRTSSNEKDIASYAANADSTQSMADTVQKTNTMIQERLTTLDSKVDSQLTGLSNTIDEKISALDNTVHGKIGQLQQETSTLKGSLDQLGAKDAELNSAINALAGKIKTNLNDRWLVTEASNLITIANQQAKLNHDAPAAISALEAADQRLREARDPALTAAREALTSDIIALRGVSELDVTGIALTLSKLEKDVAFLPLKNEAPAATETAAAPAETEAATDISSMASKVWNDLKSLVTVRRSFNSTSPALLPPGQKFFLQQNLRLKLEAARIALLKRDNQVFQDSINTSTAWLDEYFDTEQSATANLKSALAPYSTLDLNPALPDISKTLNLLEEWQAQQNSGEANS